MLNLFSSLFQVLINLKALVTTPSGVFFGALTSLSNLTSLNFLHLFGFSTVVKFIHAPLTTTAAQNFNEEHVMKYSSKSESTSMVADNLLFSNEETALNFRYQKFQNPLFKADYKAGNYFNANMLKHHPHMINTLIEITKGVRRPS